MIQLPFATHRAQALARLLGESERSVRLLLQGAPLLATVLALLWMGAALDMSLLPQGNAGSAHVAHAITGLMACVCAAVSLGLEALGRVAARA